MLARQGFISRKHRRAKALASFALAKRARNSCAKKTRRSSVAYKVGGDNNKCKLSKPCRSIGSSVFALAPSDSELDGDTLLRYGNDLDESEGYEIMDQKQGKRSQPCRSTGNSVFAFAPSDSELEGNDTLQQYEDDLNESEEDEIMDLIANDDDDEDDWHYVQTARRTSSLRPCSHSHDVLHVDHIKTLKREGLVVIDNALSKEKLEEALNACKLLRTKGAFSDSANENEDIRTDRVYYLTGEDREQQERDQKLGKKYIANKQLAMTGEERGLLYVQGFLQGMGAVLEACKFNGFQPKGQSNTPPESVILKVPDPVQLALYGKSGTRYTAHRDGAEDGTPGMYSLRVVTAILYLNDHSVPWDRSQHSGCLRCYMAANASDRTGSSAKKIIDIDPVGGRLVLFSSKTVLHEVMPTFRDRFAMTVWFLKETQDMCQ